MKIVVFNITKNIFEENIKEKEINMISEPPIFFDFDSFHKLHYKFADEVYKCYLKMNNKYICWFYVGIKDDILDCSYSSPFSLFYVFNKWRFDDLVRVGTAISRIGELLGVNKVKITLPPDIYAEKLINALIPSFLNSKFYIGHIDINNYFDLSTFLNKSIFTENLAASYKKQYNQALKYNLKFDKLPKSSWEDAYKIIYQNRLDKSYPLKINAQHMGEIINLKESNVDCFVVKLGKINIAAAIVFEITKEVCQVVYWGDVLEYREKKAMAFLVANLVEYYASKKKQYLDIGISSEHGIMNIGLVNFKKSIGCSSNLKFTLYCDI